jgi:hypothetical protein
VKVVVCDGSLEVRVLHLSEMLLSSQSHLRSCNPGSEGVITAGDAGDEGVREYMLDVA